MINKIVTNHVDSQMKSSAELEPIIRGLEKKIKTVRDNKNKLASSVNSLKGMIEKLNRISTTHGENSIVRLKGDGKIKYGKSSSTLKNLFNLDADRLAKERLAAVKLIHTEPVPKDVKTVTAKECSEYFSNLVNDGNSKLSMLSSELPKLEEKLNAVKEKFRSANTQEKKIDEAKNDINARIQVFSIIYHSDHGYPLINAAARSKYGNPSSNCNKALNHKDIIETYTQINDKAFKNEKYKDLPLKIKRACENMDKLVEDSAKLTYKPSDVIRTAFRGQSMTTDGVNKLIQKFSEDKDKKYSAGQFFSTTTNKEIAYGFANRNVNKGASIPVRYTVNGSSSVNMFLPSGLGYNKAENERMYSPLAIFKVAGFSRVQDEGGAEYINIKLNEVERTSETVEPLPA